MFKNKPETQIKKHFGAILALTSALTLPTAVFAQDRPAALCSQFNGKFGLETDSIKIDVNSAVYSDGLSIQDRESQLKEAMVSNGKNFVFEINMEGCKTAEMNFLAGEQGLKYVLELGSKGFKPLKFTYSGVSAAATKVPTYPSTFGRSWVEGNVLGLEILFPLVQFNTHAEQTTSGQKAEDKSPQVTKSKEVELFESISSVSINQNFTLFQLQTDGSLLLTTTLYTESGELSGSITSRLKRLE